MGITGQVILDLSGYKNHLSATAGTGITWVHDGGGHMIDLNNNTPVWSGASTTRPQLNFTSGHCYSVGGWIRWKGTGWNDGALVSYLNNSPSNYSGFMIFANSTDINFYINGAVRVQGATPGIGKTFHVLCTWNRTRARLYIDGVLQNDNAYAVAPAAQGLHLCFGGYTINGASGTPANIIGAAEYVAECHIWNRLLTDHEIWLLSLRRSIIHELRVRRPIFKSTVVGRVGSIVGYGGLAGPCGPIIGSGGLV